MRVGIIQSAYLPWRGYFDFIDDVDLFLMFDDVAYTNRSWRTRNRIRVGDTATWLSVPVHKAPRGTLICDMRVDYGQDWVDDHLNRIRLAYRHAPFFEPYFERLQAHLESRTEMLSDLNMALTTWLAGELGVTTPIRATIELGATGAKTDRLLSVLEAVGATTYLSGPAAKDYLDEDAFEIGRAHV